MLETLACGAPLADALRVAATVASTRHRRSSLLKSATQVANPDERQGALQRLGFSPRIVADLTETTHERHRADQAAVLIEATRPGLRDASWFATACYLVLIAALARLIVFVISLYVSPTLESAFLAVQVGYSSPLDLLDYCAPFAYVAILTVVLGEGRIAIASGWRFGRFRPPLDGPRLLLWIAAGAMSGMNPEQTITKLSADAPWTRRPHLYRLRRQLKGVTLHREAAQIVCGSRGRAALAAAAAQVDEEAPHRGLLRVSRLLALQVGPPRSGRVHFWLAGVLVVAATIVTVTGLHGAMFILGESIP